MAARKTLDEKLEHILGSVDAEIAEVVIMAVDVGFTIASLLVRRAVRNRELKPGRGAQAPRNGEQQVPREAGE